MRRLATLSAGPCTVGKCNLRNDSPLSTCYLQVQAPGASSFGQNFGGKPQNAHLGDNRGRGTCGGSCRRRGQAELGQNSCPSTRARRCPGTRSKLSDLQPTGSVPDESMELPRPSLRQPELYGCAVPGALGLWENLAALAFLHRQPESRHYGSRHLRTR